MNENKLKNFLINGFQPIEESDEDTEYYDKENQAAENERTEHLVLESADGKFDLRASVMDMETELLRIRYLLENLRDAEPQLPDMSQYVTTKEQLKAVTAAVSKRDAEAGNKALVKIMEAISVMREDFFKLCQGMRGRINELSAETVLSSFEAYSVDIENILSDEGVFIGAFPYDRLNTLYHRIIGIVPTGNVEKDGMIAERLSDGYKIGDKVLLKEKVTVYKYDAKLAESIETDSEMPSKTDSKTDYESAGKDPADGKTAVSSMEEEE